MSRSEAPERQVPASRPFAGAEAFASFWERSGDMALTLQGAFLRDLTGWFGRLPGAVDAPAVLGAPAAGPEAEALQAASRAYEKSWATALDVAETTLSNLRDNLPAAVGEESALRDILDPGAWFPAGGRSGRSIADLGAVFVARAEAATRAAAVFRRRGIEHEIVLIEAWMRSAGAFARSVIDPAVSGPPDPAALAGLWRDTADRTLDELRRAPAFAATMRAFVEAAANLEVARTALGETFAEMHGLPSRAEVDELRASVARLEREMRDLRRGAGPADRETPTRPARTSADEAEGAGESSAAALLPIGSGAAGCETVWESGRCQLVRLDPPAGVTRDGILAVVDAPLGLTGRSESALAARIADGLARDGRNVFRIRWSPPPEARSRDLALDDLVAHDLADALGAAAGLCPGAPLGLVGLGAGGVLALAHATRHPDAVAAITLVGTVIDHAPRGVEAPDGDWFDALAPDEFARCLAAAPILRRWFEEGGSPRASAAGPDWAGYHRVDWAVPALAEWRARIVADNGLMRGTLAIGGQPVDLGRIACPILNVFAEDAARASRALAGLVGAEDYTELPLPELPGRDPAAVASDLVAWFGDRLP